MFNKQLSGINKRMPNAAAKSMEIDDDSDKLHLTEAGRLSGFKLYHPERYVPQPCFYVEEKKTFVGRLKYPGNYRLAW